MNLNSFLSLLKEELKDIPKNPDNVHYTDFEGLYYILQSGLKGQKGGYTIHSPKTKKDDMELATVRNTHKLSDDEKEQLSLGVLGGVKINLFTDRILTAHRGTRKDEIAELPEDSIRYLKKQEKNFKEYYGFDLPKLFDKEKENFQWRLGQRKGEDMNIAEAWVEKNHPELSPEAKRDVMVNITIYNRGWLGYYHHLKNREREERFILKKNIPVNPDFISIEIEKEPKDISKNDKEFCKEVAKNYLYLIDKHSDVFVQNRNLRLFKNYLRSKING